MSFSPTVGILGGHIWKSLLPFNPSDRSELSAVPHHSLLISLTLTHIFVNQFFPQVLSSIPLIWCFFAVLPQDIALYIYIYIFFFMKTSFLVFLLRVFISSGP